MGRDIKWKLIGRGQVGWHASAPNVSSSGGNLEDQPWWAGGIQTGYLTDAEEGALVYDAREADFQAFSNLVIKGPMCDTGLGPEEINPFSKKDAETLAKMTDFLQGGFKGIAQMALSGLSSMDYVGIGIYERLLRSIPGIKIGHVHNKQVVWE